MERSSNIDAPRAPQTSQTTGDSSETLLLGASSVPSRQPEQRHKKPVDPIYGPDAADTFVDTYFDKKHPYSFKPASLPDAEKHKDLSIFVNLSANRGLLNSSLREEQELRKLEALTRGKPVTVVAQIAMNRDMSLNHLRATQADRIISNLGGLDPDVKQIEVVRYEVANGSKKLLYSGPSRGLSGDLTDLLESDPNALKADRVMLFNRAHGTAMHGIRGDAGVTSITELKSILGNALKNSGHQKFDLLDLDSCLMGNAQVLTELSPVAKYVIGSEEPEVAVAQLDMSEQGKANTDLATSNAQPIAEEVRKLLLAPSGDLKLSSAAVFATNEEQCARVSEDGLCGANTLALYNEAAAPEFSQSLDNFGQVLSSAANVSKDNMAALQKDIKDTPVIDGEPDGMNHTIKRRDLELFAEAVKTDLQTGKLTDDANADIAHATDQLIASMSKLRELNFNSYKPQLKAKFDEVHLPATTLGGISMFLMDRQPPDMRTAFERQEKDDSLDYQPHWNAFVKQMGTPEK
jgi:hypothetical protein